jgi:uncharacterized protein YndB with AHSA1/START domain
MPDPATTGPSGSFDLTLDVAADPATVWAAFAELPLRRRWVRLPGSTPPDGHTLDFRVGGLERIRSLFRIGDHTETVARTTVFLDIVREQRLVFAYTAVVDEIPRWASLVGTTFTPSAAGTRVEWVEQYTFLHRTGDGSDDVRHLRGGTRLHLNGLLALVAPISPASAPGSGPTTR